jgi:hypothetical protein
MYDFGNNHIIDFGVNGAKVPTFNDHHHIFPSQDTSPVSPFIGVLHNVQWTLRETPAQLNPNSIQRPLVTYPLKSPSIEEARDQKTI